MNEVCCCCCWWWSSWCCLPNPYHTPSPCLSSAPYDMPDLTTSLGGDFVHPHDGPFGLRGCPGGGGGLLTVYGHSTPSLDRAPALSHSASGNAVVERVRRGRRAMRCGLTALPPPPPPHTIGTAAAGPAVVRAGPAYRTDRPRTRGTSAHETGCGHWAGGRAHHGGRGGGGGLLFCVPVLGRVQRPPSHGGGGDCAAAGNPQAPDCLAHTLSAKPCSIQRQTDLQIMWRRKAASVWLVPVFPHLLLKHAQYHLNISYT